MAINFDALPSKKPGNNIEIADGRYDASVYKAEMVAGKDGAHDYLRVTFKLDQGGFVSENYFDSDKAFPQYKISRLLQATKIALEGTGKLEDIAKLIKNKNVNIAVTKNDRGYGTLDYSGENEGIYPVDNETPSVEADVAEAVIIDDDEF